MMLVNKMRPHWREVVPLAIAAAIALFAVYVLLRPPAPPITYTQHEYTPERAILAPGETLVYTPTLIIRAAGRLDVLRTFWSLTRDTDARLCSGGAAPIEQISRNRPAGVIGNVRGGQAVRLPIPNLPPGDYLLLTSVTGPARGQSDTQVRFKVTKACG